MRAAATALVLFGIIDRVEGAWAVVEWRTDDGLQFQDLPLRLLPAGAGEGDGLRAALRGRCARSEGVRRFLRDAEACGGRMHLRSAPPWTGTVHIEDRRQP